MLFDYAFVTVSPVRAKGTADNAWPRFSKPLPLAANKHS